MDLEIQTGHEFWRVLLYFGADVSCQYMFGMATVSILEC